MRACVRHGNRAFSVSQLNGRICGIYLATAVGVISRFVHRIRLVLSNCSFDINPHIRERPLYRIARLRICNAEMNGATPFPVVFILRRTKDRTPLVTVALAV